MQLPTRASNFRAPSQFARQRLRPSSASLVRIVAGYSLVRSTVCAPAASERVPEGQSEEFGKQLVEWSVRATDFPASLVF